MPLVREELYGDELALRIFQLGGVARSVTDRWMLGWQEQVQALIKTGLYLELLMDQAEKELDVLVDVDSSQRHLADHELLALANISPAPPVWPPVQRDHP